MRVDVFDEMVSEQLKRNMEAINQGSETNLIDFKISGTKFVKSTKCSEGGTESAQVSEVSFTSVEPTEQEEDEPTPENLNRNERVTPPSSIKLPKVELKTLPSHLRYAFVGENNMLPIIISSKLTESQEQQVIQVVKNHILAIGWQISDIRGISPSVVMHKIHLEDESKSSAQRQRRLNPNMKEVVHKEIVKLLDARIIYPISDSPWVSPIQCVPKKRGMPFGLCNAPTIFQLCMTSIFSDMMEDVMEVFMDDFSVFGDSFEGCLKNLDRVIARCEETNLVLNWEKCHFMVEEGVVLGNKISKDGIEVDRAKTEVIEKLPPPTTVKGVRAFLGHVGFYRRFIKDFSSIARPLTNLLLKDAPFDFPNDCLLAFEKLKEALVSAPIISSPDWELPFELMCDASDQALGCVLGQKKDKKLHVIYYASRTMAGA
ncbi:uncharacterized protein LOC126656933 [Mercurialis annua]|uniref:uncharacterized protein LOC126656933 n=1 Tax=Mercurialis annua TaxID=3986 RepID=UPI00215E2374|nr:uncharacterized protein LOC126656933 [Mercurialis annua]